jgi:tetratricopeptide (TPR) repeat protein
MERAAGFTHADTGRAKLDKLDAVLALASTSKQDAALFAEMLSLPNDGRYPALELTPQQRRQKTLEALHAQVETFARKGPVLIILEDVHWADPTSLEAFGRAVDRVATLRVLLIVTFRPEFEPPWIGQPHVTALTINRLTERDVGAIIDRIVGNKPLPASIRHDIIERTDGIPLFVEEMTKAVLEAEGEGAAEGVVAAVPSAAVAVPASLHASLMARLDRLGPAKGVAQIGAAIGREFSHALLAAVVRKQEAELASALDRLIAAGLLFRQGVPPHATYLFKHALVQDAAYGTLLRSPRQALHARIAAAMQERFAEIVERAPEVLAHHLTEAGELDGAAKYWLEAGRRAAERSANIEAVAHLTRGIAALKILPETPDIAQLELALQLALGPALMATKGFGTQQAKSTYQRACYLAEQSGDDRTHFAALWGLWLSAQAITSGKEPEALSDELCRVAERIGDSGLRLQAHHSAWATLLWSGRLLESFEHVRQGLSLYDRDKHRSHALTYGGHDPGVCACGQGALVSWLLGYPDQAVQSARDGIGLAGALSHIPSVGHSLMLAALTHYLRRDVPMVLDCSERLIALGREHGLAQYQAWGDIAHGWALAQIGRVDVGLSELRRVLSLCSASTKLLSAVFSTMLAEAELRLGSVAEAITILEAGDRESIDLFWRAGILHVKGLALAAQDDREAAACFRASLDIAREQQAKSLELRAATSLAQLYQHQSRRPEARDLLAPVYDWFTEGFDTLDLKQAKALLEELSS